MPNFTSSDKPTLSPQASWVHTPFIRVFTDANTQILENDINSYLDSLANPEQLEPKYVLRAVSHSSARKANNVVQYSALLHFDRWEKT